MRDSEKNLTHLQRVLLFKDSRSILTPKPNRFTFSDSKVPRRIDSFLVKPFKIAVRLAVQMPAGTTRNIKYLKQALSTTSPRLPRKLRGTPFMFQTAAPGQ